MFQSKVEIYLRIPTNQSVIYIPGILETLKFGWLQYQAALIPSLLIWSALMGFILRYQILETNIVKELDRKRIV